MDIHMDTGELGSGSFAMRISLNPDGTPVSFTEAPAILDLESLMAASGNGVDGVFAQPEDSNEEEEAASALHVCPLNTLSHLCSTACVPLFCALRRSAFTSSAFHLKLIKKDSGSPRYRPIPC